MKANIITILDKKSTPAPEKYLLKSTGFFRVEERIICCVPTGIKLDLEGCTFILQPDPQFLLSGLTLLGADSDPDGELMLFVERDGTPTIERGKPLPPSLVYKSWKQVYTHNQKQYTNHQFKAKYNPEIVPEQVLAVIYFVPTIGGNYDETH